MIKLKRLQFVKPGVISTIFSWVRSAIEERSVKRLPAGHRNERELSSRQLPVVPPMMERLRADSLVLVTCDLMQYLERLLKDDATNVTFKSIQLRLTTYYSPRERRWRA